MLRLFGRDPLVRLPARARRVVHARRVLRKLMCGVVKFREGEKCDARPGGAQFLDSMVFSFLPYGIQ